jgi:hypothetical protein
MKKFLDSDWLRAVQFQGNTVQKKGNTVQKKGNTVQIFFFENGLESKLFSILLLITLLSIKSMQFLIMKEQVLEAKMAKKLMILLDFE